MAVAAGIVLLLGGCIQTVVGTPAVAPEPPRPPSYREKLTAQMKAHLSHLDELRGIDPCSLIDRDAAAALAPISYVGTDRDPLECEIDFVVPTTPPKEGFGDRDEVPGHVSQLHAGSRAIDSSPGDQLDHPIHGGGGCLSFLDTGYTQPDGWHELLEYNMTISSDFGGHERPGCEDLDPVVDASRGKSRNPGTRSSSTTLPHATLMTMDPCAAVDVLGTQTDIELIDHPDPFRCDFRNRGDTDNESNTARSIRFTYTELSVAEDVKKFSKDYRQLRGVPADVSAGAGYVGQWLCTVTAYVGLKEPGAGSDPLSSGKQWVSAISVFGGDTHPDCRSVVAVTDEAIHQYQLAH
ncbi:hypothetical protein BKG76_00200 [Mycobacteroides franklinii]|uniref:DUF3558 domain-containing protein n=1 Tax=Mycobacteroides franklinii TaxID=948102 RepID=A0A1S1LBW7_9MYCO|nr:hypothetical protein [Mycobacteroides franklinii]OHU31676.1 hypothetical protein BKG76_00200 [Mycobacteroides franklinii]